MSTCPAVHSGDGNPECADGEGCVELTRSEAVRAPTPNDATADLLRGREEIKAFLKRQRDNELDYRILPVPATYVIDTNGIMTLVFVDVDYRNRLPAEILAALVIVKRTQRSTSCQHFEITISMLTEA